MNHAKPYTIPKEDIMTEARKMIRKENLERLAKEKEERIVNKEIEQLKQSLENDRLLQKMALEARTTENKKPNNSVIKFAKKNNKVWKKLESYDACWEIDTWFSGGCGPQSTNINLHEKGKCDNKAFGNFRITVKKKDIDKESKDEKKDEKKEEDENSSELASIKGDSEISFKTQIALTKDESDTSPRYWPELYSNGKNEIMQRFFESASEIDRIKQIYKTRAQIEHSKSKFLNGLKSETQIEVENNMKWSCPEEDNRKCVEKLSDEEDKSSRFQNEEGEGKIYKIKECVDTWNLRYYWKIWRRFVLDRKSQKEKLNREKKIETFLQRLLENKNHPPEPEEPCEKKERSKNSKSSTLPKSKVIVKERSKTAPVTLENKFKEQQKKIDERKREMIKKDMTNDLKLEKIEQEVKKSSEETYENLTKNINKYHPSLRGRVKVLKTLTNLGKNKVERIDAEMQKVFPIPEVLMRMQKRDEERRKRWDEIKERKRKIQEERERIQKEKEEEMKLMEENEKKRKLEELKEKRRLQKEAEEESKREREKLRRQLKQAEVHYKTVLLRKYGMDPWKCLIRFRSLQALQAEEFYVRKIVSSHFIAWKDYVQDQVLIKETKADLLYRKILLRNCFQIWIEKCNDKIKQYQVAVDWADTKLTERVFKCWVEFVHIQQMEYMDNISKAEDFHAR